MSTFKETEHELKQQYRDDLQAKEDQEAITAFLRFHISELIPCVANRQHIIRYFNGDPITHQALADAFEHHPAFRAGFARTTEARARETIEAKIINLLTGSDSAIAHERAKFKFKSLEELQSWLEELERRTGIQKLPKEELRKLAAGTQTSRFQEIEPLYRDPEMLAGASPQEIRRLIRVCGLDAVNAVLSKRSRR